MKQLLTIILVVLLIVCAGCSSKNHLNESSVSDTSSYVESQQDQTNTSQKETFDAEDIPTTTERSDETTTKKSVSTESTPSKTDNEVKSDKKEPQTTVSDTTSNNTSSKKETTSETQKPTEESKENNITEGMTSGLYYEQMASLCNEVGDSEKEAYYEHALEADIKSLGQAMSRVIFSDREAGYGNEIVLYPNSITFMSMENKLTALQVGLPAGIFTKNEARELLGYAPIEGGDVMPRGYNEVDATGDDESEVIKNE